MGRDNVQIPTGQYHPGLTTDSAHPASEFLLLGSGRGAHSPQDLYFSEAASAAGVTTVAAYQLWSQPREDPVWRDVVPHFRHLSTQELQPFEKAGSLKLYSMAASGPCYCRH